MFDAIERLSLWYSLAAVVLAACVGGCVVEIPAEQCDPECGPGLECRAGECVATDASGGERRAGDVGEPCDPSLPEDENTCETACLEMEGGDGICIDACGPDGSNPCEGPGVKCNELPDPETGEMVHVCLPNGSCGDLTYRGRCDGSVARKCGVEGPIEVDCSEQTGPNGEPQKCARVNERHGVSCVSSDYDGGCGDVPPSGTCEGNTLVYCQSAASGTVERRDCGDGARCVEENGSAECRPTGGGTSCGDVTAAGTCRGNRYVWCDTDSRTLRERDCGSSGTSCGWNKAEGSWGCVERGGGAHTVRGSFFYEDREISTDGFESTRNLEIQDALVQVRDARSNEILGAAHTGTDGSFSVDYASTSNDVYVAVLAATNHDGVALAVRDCPSQNCSGGGAVYGAGSETFRPGSESDLGELVVPADGVGPAFNVFTVLRFGFAFAKQNIGQTPPALTAHWKPGVQDPCGDASCFLGRSDTILVNGRSDDPDPYDDYVLAHEFGHFIEDAFSRTDSPGGYHDGSPTDPLLAWGEGYGTFVGCSMLGAPYYIDVTASGELAVDISDNSFPADRHARSGMTQPISEFLVAEVLWHLSNGGAGAQKDWTGRIFDVLSNYFPTQRLVDRGVAGVDLVDFLDGWFCRGHGARSTVRQLVVDENGFPYDFGGPNACR